MGITGFWGVRVSVTGSGKSEGAGEGTHRFDEAVFSSSWATGSSISHVYTKVCFRLTRHSLYDESALDRRAELLKVEIHI